MIKKKDLKLTVDELLEKYPVKNLISDLLEMVNTKVDAVVVEQPKIAVSKEEFEQICSIFRIKGFDVNGNPSKRGRKPKNV